MNKETIEWYAIRYDPAAGRKRRIAKDGPIEFVVETLLRKRGFKAFLPTKQVWRRKSKYTREKHLVPFPVITGWVFVGWPQGRPRWHELFQLRLVSEVAGIDGRPYPIPQADIDHLFNRWGGSDALAPERERFMQTGAEYKVGDQVRVLEGPFDGFEARVCDLRGVKAKIMLNLLGGVREIEIDGWILEAA